MGGSTHISVASPGAAPLLPRELFWFCLLAPVPASFLLVPDLMALPLGLALQKIASTYIPFLSISVALLPAYLWALPKVLSRIGSRVARGLLHVVVVTAIAFAVSVAVRPLHLKLCGVQLSVMQFGVMCVLISYAMVFPSLWIQGGRVRAQVVEQLAMAQCQAALRAQLDALQARTNPHFFFNSINTVASLIPENPVLAERTLERLADLFRYALDSSTTRSVPLSREFEMVREYLAIEAARFGDRLQVKVELDPEAADLQVPPLLLQPLVENAILHGLSQRQGGVVELTARRVGTQIVIDVRDDGPGPGASAHRGTQTSVRDILERLRLSFGDAARFTLEEAQGGGCIARLALPCP